MGYAAEGSDIDQRMIDYTSANLDWLGKTYDKIWDVGRGFQLGDATSHVWRTSEFIGENGEVVDAKRVPMRIDAVACETYLGRPFTSMPDAQMLNQTVSEVNLILQKFLRNIGGQIKPGTRLCLAVPAWQIRPGQFKHLPLLDQIQNMGYNRISFGHVRDADLLYYREDQLVARQLLVLEKK
jgi:tRNA G10  N-methylase Trm11